MHEKRFTVHKTIGMLHAFYVNDNLTDKVVIDQIIHKYEANRLCDKLNELHKEKIHFESEMYAYKGSEEYYKQLLIEKDEENLHLKNALNKIKEIIDEE